MNTIASRKVAEILQTSSTTSIDSPSKPNKAHRKCVALLTANFIPTNPQVGHPSLGGLGQGNPPENALKHSEV